MRDAAAGDRLELSFIDRSSGEEVGHALVTFDFGAGEQAIRMEQDGKVVFERQSAANLERDEIEEKVLALYVRHRSLGNL